MAHNHRRNGLNCVCNPAPNLSENEFTDTGPGRATVQCPASVYGHWVLLQAVVPDQHFQAPYDRPAALCCGYKCSMSPLSSSPGMEARAADVTRLLYLERSVLELVSAHWYLELTNSKLLGWYLALPPGDRRIILNEGGFLEFLTRHPGLELSNGLVYVKRTPAPVHELHWPVLPAVVREGWSAVSSPPHSVHPHCRGDAPPQWTSLQQTQVSSDWLSWQTQSGRTTPSQTDVTLPLSVSADMELKCSASRQRLVPHVSTSKRVRKETPLMDTPLMEGRRDVNVDGETSRNLEAQAKGFRDVPVNDGSILVYVTGDDLMRERSLSHVISQKSTPPTTTISTQTPPTTISTKTPPSTISTQTPPTTISTKTPPTTISTQTPPTTISTKTPPSTISTQTPPTTISTQTPPSTKTPPSTISTKTPPSTISTQTPPSTISTQTPKPETVDKHFNTVVLSSDLDHIAEEFLKLRRLLLQKEKNARERAVSEQRAQQAELSLLTLQFVMCKQHCSGSFCSSAEELQHHPQNEAPPADVMKVLQRLESDWENMKEQVLAGVPLEGLQPLCVDSFVPAQIITDTLSKASLSSQNPSGEADGSTDEEQKKNQEEPSNHVEPTNQDQDGNMSQSVCCEDLSVSEAWFDAEEYLQPPQHTGSRDGGSSDLHHH
ncbi:RNA-binding protein 44-like [Gouania willdenowi]|uniref:RNA-binding protein 44-like n=1 Tax=Gouania willdenowi TaxID=441366 RepID=UPI001056DB5C|nr:RNA-binding protein 44-like [Gouania willdenowi]